MNKFRDKDVLFPHPHPAPPLSYYSLTMVLMNCCDYRNRIALQDSPTGSSWTVLQVAHYAQDAVLHWPGPVPGGGDIFSFLQRPYRLVVALIFPPLTSVFSSNSLFLFVIPSSH